MPNPISRFAFPRLSGANDIAPASSLRIGVVDNVLDQLGGMQSIRMLFPDVVFESLGEQWPKRPSPSLQAVIVPVDGDRPKSVLEALERLSRVAAARVIIVLRSADVETTHRLARAGAIDVLPAPITESALAVTLERLRADSQRGAQRETREIIAVLKAGGGVGATMLACQSAAMIASRGGAQVCLADLDLQGGDAAIQLDLPKSASIADLLSLGSGLEETAFQEVLGKHGSGLRLLAAPEDIMALDTVSPDQIEGLVNGLRRDFEVTFIDLPPVWTPWTTAVLNEADRILLVTNLTVPHIQMTKRQLATLALLDLDSRPIILACNQVNPEQQSSLSQKAAERALGRSIDVMIPEDRRVMTAASNQGLEIRDVQKGGKLHNAVLVLADMLADRAPAAVARRGAA